MGLFLSHWTPACEVTTLHHLAELTYGTFVTQPLLYCDTGVGSHWTLTGPENELNQHLLYLQSTSKSLNFASGVGSPHPLTGPAAAPTTQLILDYYSGVGPLQQLPGPETAPFFLQVSHNFTGVGSHQQLTGPKAAQPGTTPFCADGDNWIDCKSSTVFYILSLGVGSPPFLTGLPDGQQSCDFLQQREVTGSGDIGNTDWHQLDRQYLSTSLREHPQFCRVGSCYSFSGLVDPLPKTHCWFLRKFGSYFQLLIEFGQPQETQITGTRSHQHSPHCRVGSCYDLTGRVNCWEQLFLVTSTLQLVSIYSFWLPPPFCGVGSRFRTGRVDSPRNLQQHIGIHNQTPQQCSSEYCPPNCRVGSWNFFTGLVEHQPHGEGTPSDCPALAYFPIDIALHIQENDQIFDHGTSTTGSCDEWLCFLLFLTRKQNWGWAPLIWLALIRRVRRLILHTSINCLAFFNSIISTFGFFLAAFQRSWTQNTNSDSWFAPSCWLNWPLRFLQIKQQITAFLDLVFLGNLCLSEGIDIFRENVQRAPSNIKIGGKPGPKSRRQTWAFQLLCVSVIAMSSHNQSVGREFGRSEGNIPAMGDVETSPWKDVFSSLPDVKPHGTQPQMCGSTKTALTTCKNSKVVKRSLYRAQRRAHTQGFAWYRGQCMTPQDFLQMGMPPVPLHTPQLREQDLTRCNAKQRPRSRLTCLTWNCGGLSSHRLDELKHWLLLQQVQIAVITETRWSFQAEWSDTNWHHLHSADIACRGSGVLVLVSSKLCNAPDIRWTDPIPGRLIHVRLQMPTRNIDIVGCYQHVYSGSKRSMPLRESFWRSLELILQQLPARNTVTLLGDMNCSLPASSGVSGTSFFRWQGRPKQGPQHPDSGRFLSILHQFGIVALNTWDGSQCPTFAQNGAASRIDYICTRAQHADGQARAVQTLWQAPFLPVQQHGHAPLLSHIAKHWIPPTNQPKFGLTPHQRRRGQLAKLSHSLEWDQFLTDAAPAVWTAFQQVLTSDKHEMQDVHDTAMHHFATRFPAMSRHAEPDPWQQNVHTLNKWKHRQILHDIKARTSQGIFHAWFHAAQFLKLTRSHRRFAKQLRRQRFEETLQQANHAATHHDTHKLFDLINRFAPKVHRRRVQLRREDGTLMTSSEERSLLVEFVRTTWRGPPMEPMICQAAPGVPFTVSELSEALRMIPSQKATAAPCAPGIVWNSLAEIIAPVLHATLTKWWGQNPPWIPRQWRAGWLQLIPKPSKPPTRPQNLRPLALQCPVGKAILGLLIQKAVAQADAAFRQLPLWAFMRRRSTQDPLLHVAKHCRDTRTLIQSQRSTPHTRAISAERWTICGGIQIFLDLEKAFDCINRVKLFSKLTQLGVNEQTTQLLQNWHIDTQYIISHGGESAAVDVSRGLRQGCKGAPFLWNCMMVLMLQEMQHLISLDWLNNTCRYTPMTATLAVPSGTCKSLTFCCRP